jgi:hypothetical protein
MAFQHAIESDSQYAGLVEIAGTVIRSTAKAMLFNDGTREAWLPLSKIKFEEGRDGIVIVYMPMWLAKKGKYV